MTSAPTTIPGSDDAAAGGEGGALLVARAMLDTLDGRSRAEIERALRLTLFEPPSLQERRQGELDLLARMLDKYAEQLGLIAPGRRRRFGAPLDDAEIDRLVREPFPRLPVADYDAARAGGDPTSAQLTARFGGSWPLTCRAVWGLMADGRYAGRGTPWATHTTGRPRVQYTDEERIAALRACARRFGRIPTVTLYARWVRRRNAHARRTGRELPRLPTYESYRDRWGGWPAALKAAQITDADLAAGRARHLSGPAATAVQPDAREPDTPTPALIDLTPDAIRQARQDRGLSEAALRAAAGLTLSEWRRFARGQLELTDDASSAVRGALN